MKNLKIEKKELYFSLLGILLIVGWFLFLKNIFASFLSNLFPFYAMLISSIILFLGLFLLCRSLNGNGQGLKIAILTLIVILAVDIIATPYLVTTEGVLMNTVEYWFVSADVGFASLYQLFLPLSFVWFVTYIITPIILLCLTPIIFLKPKQIAKMLH